MKTSLLLLGFIAMLGCAGAARAADVSSQTHVMAEASSTGHGVLATLGALFSGSTDACSGGGAAMTAVAGSDSASAGDDNLDTSAGHSAAGAGGNPVIPDGGQSRAPSAAPGGGSGGKRSSLGWQSLLPGSIQ